MMRSTIASGQKLYVYVYVYVYVCICLYMYVCMNNPMYVCILVLYETCAVPYTTECCWNAVGEFR